MSGSSFHYSFQASSGTLTSNGSFAQWTPAGTSGSSTVTCQATNNLGQTTSATTSIEVETSAVATSVALNVPAGPFYVGGSVSLTAVVTSVSQAPTGNVTFYDGAAAIAIVAVASTGIASTTIANLSQGTHSLSANYSGNSTLSSSVSPSVSRVVSPTSSSQGSSPPTVNCSASPSAVIQGGQSLISASASSASGSPLQLHFSASAGTLNVSGSSAMLSTATVPPGSITITCQATDDFNQSATATSVVNVIAAQSPDTMTLLASPLPAIAGQPVTLTALLSATSGTPSGSVSFMDGGTVIGTAPISSGAATLITSPLAQGTHALTATYPGNSLTTGNSASLSLVVSPAPSTTVTTLTALPDSAVAGTPVTLISTVAATSGSVSGTVTFMDGNSLLGTSTITTTGQAQLSVSTLSQGTHSITAVFAGSSSLAASTSTPVPVVITPRPAPPTISCSAAPSSINAGGTTTITASASSSSGQPLAILFSGSAGTLVTSGSSAVFNSAGVAPGTVAVTCKATDALGQTSSAIASVVINPVLLATTTVLTATPATVIAGNSVVLTAAVSASSPVSSGTVTFSDAGTTLGTSSVTTTGQAQLSVSTLSQGTHSITAVFAGSSSLAASTSPPVSVVVSASAQPTISCSVAPSSVNPGDQAYITAVASSAAGRTTTVSFSTSGGNLSVTGRSATLNTTGITSGAVEITCKATDDLGQTGSATTSLWINGGQGEQALTAYNFTDSVGVNIHLHFTNTPEVMDFPDFLTSIIALGVHHYRNGIDPYAVPFEYASAETLAGAGIKADWLISSADAPQNINAIYANAPNSIEAFEGPNEDNTDAGPVLANFMSMLYSTVKGNPNTATVPVYAPTLTELPLIGLQGSLAAYDNYANMHDYYYPRNPETASYGSSFFGCAGYGSMAFNICIAQLTSPGTPVISTETGYISGTQSDEVLGRYITRTLFMHLGMNVMRTYLYEFVDDVDSPGFGLVHSDFTPKPAYTAIKNLISLFNDQSFATPGKFDYTLTGQTNNVQHVLFQKSDGTYMMAIWLGVQSADEVSPYETFSIPPQTVSIATETPVGNVTVYTLDDEGNMTNSPGDTVTSTTSLAVTDRITIVTFSPSSN